jgi:hypothetical protein
MKRHDKKKKKKGKKKTRSNSQILSFLHLSLFPMVGAKDCHVYELTI